MKKIRTTLALFLALGFVSATSLVSCGSKKEEATEETMEMEHEEGEHPAEGEEHPTEHPTEHPADTTVTDTTSTS